MLGRQDQHTTPATPGESCVGAAQAAKIEAGGSDGAHDIRVDHIGCPHQAKAGVEILDVDRNETWVRATVDLEVRLLSDPHELDGSVGSHGEVEHEPKVGALFDVDSLKVVVVEAILELTAELEAGKGGDLHVLGQCRKGDQARDQQGKDN